MPNIYVDESENNNLFLLAAVITNNIDALRNAIYKTRKYVKSKKRLSKRLKEKILNEMKYYFLENEGFHDIKTELIQNIIYKNAKKHEQSNSYETRFISCFYVKRDYECFNQHRKQKVYLACLLKILNVIDNIDNNETKQEYHLIYDEIGSKQFQEEIKQAVKEKYGQAITIGPGKSNEIKELQVADICAGCFRRKVSGEDADEFELLKDYTIIVRTELP